ncbi:dTDP-4-dehydrorhamnose reductase [Pseudonocardia parietis]|uniref:dTDP-4-dehydrorhamnose reductase n=1 Tax=Pseudonocardia parietis TaxID=570936 RepID=A0ABS4VS41_9PSEU|nr:dTDP-4-dehydrorhamnose reductase [Pseudonocardia parietis]MBP2366369.1 dTDP-4-dehydrorhamnose 3,5-epimerase [Pseudonocardia parietis]
MRACVLGANGQLGRALAAALPDAVALGRDGLDIGDADAVAAYDFSGVDVVFNAAAHTAVDRAEAEPAAAWRTNALGPAHLAAAAARHGFTLVHVSTEYVFDGTTPGPMPEDTPLAPLGVYGASKAAGELAVRAAPRHVIARTSWVVGDGANFVATMTRLAREGVSPTVVDDQIGRPTFASDLAAALIALAGREHGTYHVTNDGEPVSWHGLAREVFARCGRSPGDVRPVTTAQYTVDKPGMARRPANSVLDLSLLIRADVAMPPWRDSLDIHMGLNA